MRGTKGNDEAILENQGHIKSYKGTRTLAQVPNIVLPVAHVVLDDHMSIANTIILILCNDKVIDVLSIEGGILRPQNSASIILPSKAAL